MDEELIEDVIAALMECGDFTDEDICNVRCKLEQEDPVPIAQFEQLRLHFTGLFLQHPKMLEVLSYKDIVLKAKEFTKEYLKHE